MRLWIRRSDSGLHRSQRQELCELNGATSLVRNAPLNKQPAIFPVEWTPEELPGGRLPLEVYRGRAAALRADPMLAVRIAKLLEASFDDTEP